MNYSLNVKSSSIVHTLLSNCVKLLGKVQKLLIKCISYSVISKRIRVVSPKFYTARKNFTGPPVPTVPTNFKSGVSGHYDDDEKDYFDDDGEKEENGGVDDDLDDGKLRCVGAIIINDDDGVGLEMR